MKSFAPDGTNVLSNLETGKMVLGVLCFTGQPHGLEVAKCLENMQNIQNLRRAEYDRFKCWICTLKNLSNFIPKTEIIIPAEIVQEKSYQPRSPSRLYTDMSPNYVGH